MIEVTSKPYHTGWTNYYTFSVFLPEDQQEYEGTLIGRRSDNDVQTDWEITWTYWSPDFVDDTDIITELLLTLNNE